MTTREDYIHTNNPKGLAYFTGRPNIRAAYTYEAKEAWERDEYRKCFRDPQYFIENYCTVVTGKGFKNFKLYDYQKETIKDLHNERFVVILAPRQMGKSQLIAAYILWFVLFNGDKKCHITSKDAAGTKDILDRVIKMYENIPFFLQQGATTFSVTKVAFENGSSVTTGSSKGKAARGISGNILFADEFAFMQNPDEFYAAIYPIITGQEDGENKIFIVSTPNGMGNLFHTLWMDALKRNNKFKPNRWYWHQRPGRDETFKQETIANLKMKRWRQEFECEFLGSAKTLIEPETLEKLSPKLPISTRQQGEIRVYEDVLPGHKYVLAADVADGVGKDFSTFSVIDITMKPYRQVMVFQSNTISPYIYHEMILSWAKKYNQAFVIVENNANGGIVCKSIFIDYEYPNFYTETNMKREDIGVKTSTKTKQQGTTKLKDLIELELLEIIDENTINELMTFEQLKSSWAASPGNHDDLVMSLVLFAYFTTKENIFGEIENSDTSIADTISRLRKLQMDLDSFPISIVDDWDDEDTINGGADTSWLIDSYLEEKNQYEMDMIDMTKYYKMLGIIPPEEQNELYGFNKRLQ